MDRRISWVVGCGAVTLVLSACGCAGRGGGKDGGGPPPAEEPKPVVTFTENGRPRATENNPSTTPQRVTVGYGATLQVQVDGTGQPTWRAENAPPSWDRAADGRTWTLSGRFPMGTSGDWSMRLFATVDGVESEPFEVGPNLPAPASIPYSTVPQTHSSFGNQYFQITLPRAFVDEFDRNKDAVLDLEVSGMLRGDRLEVAYPALSASSTVEVLDSKNYDSLPPPQDPGDPQPISITIDAWQAHRGMAQGAWTLHFKLKDPHTRPNAPISVRSATLKVW